MWWKALGVWLLAMIGPVLVRLVTALGFTAVVFVGVEALISSLVVSAQSSWSTMPATVLQLASLAGVPEALGMILGAYVGLFSAKIAIQAKQIIFAPKSGSIWGQL